jgi:glucokinase
MPFVGKHPVPEIVAANLGNDAGLVGAADLSRN